MTAGLTCARVEQLGTISARVGWETLALEAHTVVFEEAQSAVDAGVGGAIVDFCLTVIAHVTGRTVANENAGRRLIAHAAVETLRRVANVEYLIASGASVALKAGARVLIVAEVVAKAVHARVRAARAEFGLAIGAREAEDTIASVRGALRHACGAVQARATLTRI